MRRSAYYIAIGLMSALVFASCAPERVKPDYSKYVWPPAPEEPRVRLLNMIITDIDIRERSGAELMFGDDPTFRFGKPHGVDVDDRGRVYVSDTMFNKVFIIDTVAKTTSSLPDPYGFKIPIGVSVDIQDRLIAVADAGAGKVYLFNLDDYSLKTIIGQKGELQNPYGVAIDSIRKLVYVSDSKKHEVLSFDFEGNPVAVVAKRGAGEGQVYYPALMDVDAEGNLYVVDTMNTRLQIFSSNGNFVKSIGTHGTSPGQFSRPKGVTVSPDGLVFVSDAAFGNFQVFDKNGNLYINVGSSGSSVGGYRIIQGIAVGSDYKVYAIDQVGRRLYIYQYLSDEYKASHPDASAPPAK